MTALCFTDQLLIAMPSLADPNFHHTVTYIGEHTDTGVLGWVINRPSHLTLGDIWAHLDIIPTQATGVEKLPVYRAGPVQPDQGFVLHQPVGQWEMTLRVTDTIGITTSRDILHALACGEGPEQVLIGFGYAGWAPGQLEQEMADNVWLSCPADPTLLFNTPTEHRWLAAARLLGVDLQLVTARAGHA